MRLKQRQCSSSFIAFARLNRCKCGSLFTENSESIPVFRLYKLRHPLFEDQINFENEMKRIFSLFAYAGAGIQNCMSDPQWIFVAEI